MTEALRSQPEAVYLALYPTEGTAVVREWIGLGGTTRMIATNSLKSGDFRAAVGQQFFAGFVEAFTAHFGRAPSGPGLSNSFDAAAVALLAYHAAGRAATGAQIAAQVPRMTGPAAEAIPAAVEGFTRAMEILSAGGNVSYQGGTGAVAFDACGDVSAPAVTWTFGGGGAITKTRYVTLEEVTALKSEMLE